MEKRQNRPSKAEVQTTKLNKIPVPGEGTDDTEFSAEEAAEAFKQNRSADRNAFASNRQENEEGPETR
ncbi:MAG: hypothetical protein C6P35_12830 [Cohnella sp.]|uniref:hypothetical protein n=1 Tax=Cohnella sp. TaxID=1883426 RepID=UPI000E369A42|nr:hypothetical protein [Cohnella sp.]REK64373.1 MAG: hypothetical protein C6P35_12830 [Cohnella sp.]